MKDRLDMEEAKLNGDGQARPPCRTGGHVLELIYIYIYVTIYIYTHVYTCIHIYIYIYIYVYIHILYLSLSIYLYIYLSIYLSIYMCVYICIYIYSCVCVYIYIYIYILYTHVYIFVYICMCNRCIYIYLELRAAFRLRTPASQARYLITSWHPTRHAKNNKEARSWKSESSQKLHEFGIGGNRNQRHVVSSGVPACIPLMTPKCIGKILGTPHIHGSIFKGFVVACTSWNAAMEDHNRTPEPLMFPRRKRLVWCLLTPLGTDSCCWGLRDKGGEGEEERGGGGAGWEGGPSATVELAAKSFHHIPLPETQTDRLTDGQTEMPTVIEGMQKRRHTNMISIYIILYSTFSIIIYNII